MYSFPDVENSRLSDEDASGDSRRRNRFSDQRVDPVVDPALTLGFDENMRKLKEANERTLDLCNRLCYQESIKESLEDDEEQKEYGEFESVSDYEEQPHTDEASISAPLFMNSNSELLNKSVGSMQNILAKNAKDNVRDFSTAEGALGSPKVSKGIQFDPRPRIRCFEASLSENDESDYERYKENRAVTIHNDTLQSAMARIEDMWGAFTVDDYAPWSSLRQGGIDAKGDKSLTKVDAESKCNRVVAAAWKKKKTVPDPPAMLLRDVNKTPVKTKAMIELDREREEKKHLEELECRKQFRARAAPDHVRLRLLEEMNRQQEERRQLLRDNGEEILKSLQKPFEFIEREEQRKREKLKEMRQSSARKSNGHFRARPFPAHIFNGTVEDKILEEEEYRRIRMRIRAEELLNSSTVPYSMRVRDRAERRSQKMESAPREESFRPRVNQTLPDPDEPYQRFMEQMIKRKEGKKPTTCKPFNLRLSKTMPRKYTIPSGDAARLPQQRSLGNKHATGSLSASLEEIPTHLLREEKRRKLPSGQRSRRKRSAPKGWMENARNDAHWNVLPGDVVYTLDNDSDDLVRSEESPNLSGSRNRMKLLRQKQSDLEDAYEDNDRPAPNNSDRLNLTFDLENSAVEVDTSEKSTSDFWSHPSLVRRSEFWSNPVTSVH